MFLKQLFSCSLLVLGIIQLVLSFFNNTPYLKLKDKVIVNESGYIKANKKRHKINGIINFLMGILYSYSIGGVENIVILVGFLAFIFNFLIFNSNTGEYLKDKN